MDKAEDIFTRVVGEGRRSNKIVPAKPHIFTRPAVSSLSLEVRSLPTSRNYLLYVFIHTRNLGGLHCVTYTYTLLPRAPRACFMYDETEQNRATRNRVTYLFAINGRRRRRRRTWSSIFGGGSSSQQHPLHY